MKRYSTYDSLYRNLKRFMNHMIKLPWDTKKSKVWVDAYKGAGAYYTCKNLIMFHDCYVKRDALYGNSFYSRDDSMQILNMKLNEYQGEGWRMFAFMKKLIADNGFDFYDAMRKKYSEEYK